VLKVLRAAVGVAIKEPPDDLVRTQLLTHR
jgi:hypothetical protein